jgi:hypothetical protein
MVEWLIKEDTYYKLFFYSYKKDFGSALKSEEQLKAEEQEYQEASDAARCLMDEGTDGAGSVKFIIDKLPIMRREANDILRTFLENIDNYKEAGIFNREIFEELMDIYDRVMLMSFQRVKFINNASVFYNGIRRNLVSRKGKLKSRIGAKNQGELAKLETILSFFINILGYYKEVISYPEDRYIKYVHNKDSEEIDKVYHLVRNIK